ncbi:MAG: bifunctional adenosylcobinamide kinase/adenosylcobinamide-phosphate guanylyltransferase [Isosphaeraceae bacterium]
MGSLILVTGGVRSGKSDFAQRLAGRLGGDDVLFVATAEARDDEMARRIEAHRRSRPAAWQTLEAPRSVGRAIRDRPGSPAVVLVDCLTLLASNELLAIGTDPDAAEAESRIVREVDELLEAHRLASSTFIVVSNEVGLGVVPTSYLGRLYRDVLGRANQLVAARADSVYLLVAGLPVDVKALASGVAPA